MKTAFISPRFRSHLRRIASASLVALCLMLGSARAESVGTVWYILLENRDFTNSETSGGAQIYGNPAAPYINSLITPGNPNAAHYSASKAGVIALTKSLGKELAAKGILVNAITPAAAKTEMFDQMTQQHIDYMLSRIPMNRFVQVEELAAMIAWLSSEDCSFSTGAVFDVSGGRATY